MSQGVEEVNIWILPTFGRPERCQATLDSIASAGASCGVVWVDGDPDPRYATLKLPNGWHKIEASRNVGLVAVLNAAFRLNPKEPWYGFISDDSIVKTRGWERKLVEAAGRAGFANSADGWQADKRMHGAIAFGGELVRSLGWIAPPALFHSCCDDAWEYLGRELANWTYVSDVMVEHQHAWNKKASDDATYRKNYSTLDADRKSFVKWVQTEGKWAIEKGRIPVDRAAKEDELMDRARSRIVMIGSPIARQPAVLYMCALVDTIQLLERQGIEHARTFEIGSSKLPSARNALMARFLASPCTDLIMIDDDMGWDPWSVIRALQSPHEITAVVGRKKVEAPNSDPEVWCGRPMMDEKGGGTADDMGFLQFTHVGTGFMKISRSACEKLIAAHPEWKRGGHGSMPPEVKKNYYRFFIFGDDEYETGEDYLFCQEWRKIGGEIWIDPAQEISHVGDKAYTGAWSEHMILKEPPNGR